jgi:hypothetical protein
MGFNKTEAIDRAVAMINSGELAKLQAGKQADNGKKVKATQPQATNSAKQIETFVSRGREYTLELDRPIIEYTESELNKVMSAQGLNSINGQTDFTVTRAFQETRKDKVIKALKNKEPVPDTIAAGAQFQRFVRPDLTSEQYMEMFDELTVAKKLSGADWVKAAKEWKPYTGRGSDVLFSGLESTGTRRPANPPSTKAVQKMVDSFLGKLAGALGVRVQVLRDQAEAELVLGRAANGKFVKGAYNRNSNTV